MRSPGYFRTFGRVIVNIIILGHIYIAALTQVALVLSVKGFRIVFHVASDIKLTSFACHHDADATFF